MGPAIDMKLKPLDVGIPMLHTHSEVRVAKHNSPTDAPSPLDIT